MCATDNTIHKEPFLSYLSSCFRYFCKLRGGRIINHHQTRWQSASIVAKKTNETAHPGKRPGDPAAIACSLTRRALDLCHAASHDAPRAGPDQIRPQKRHQRGVLCLFVPSPADFTFGWFLPPNRHRGRSHSSPSNEGRSQNSLR